ncbi:MAG: DUF1501 domain-containing protein [Gemmatimonadetes bacterium]|nr:DUF1501 domain-containing protein [Gemmatimonadota bacterium]
MISRRVFIQDGALSVVGLSMVPGFLYRAAQSADPMLARKKIFVAIFQRGGVDGLNMVVPYGDEHYYEYRPTIAIPAPSRQRDSALDLDGYFGLHPWMKEIHELYTQGTLAIVNAVGSPHSTRSHFEAQDYMESAVPGSRTVGDGWLNRYLHRNQHPEATSFRAVAMGPVLPRALKGEAPALALGEMTRGGPITDATPIYESLYSRDSNSLVSGTAQEMFDALRRLKEADPAKYAPAPGVRYPNGEFGRSLRELAQLIKADLGVEIAFVDIGGWDTHNNQGAIDNGELPTRLRAFSQAIHAFSRDLGDRMQDVVLLTMSEFGRTARENGNAGTDHGKANVMFVLGGGVQGGRIHGNWPGLAREQLNENRDLALTTDFRDVFAELLARHLGCRDLNAIFPDFTPDPARFKTLIQG